MSRKLKLGGQTWTVRIGEDPPSPDVQLLVFFCLTSGQRPYRVVQVARDRIPDQAMLDRMPADDLGDLFEASGSMDFPRGYPTYDE